MSTRTLSLTDPVDPEAVADDDGRLQVPCAEALLAGTLALMTAWADPAPGDALDQACRRSLLARKLVSNLFFLQHHPALSPRLRAVVQQVRACWMSREPGQESDRPVAALRPMAAQPAASASRPACGVQADEPPAGPLPAPAWLH